MEPPKDTAAPYRAIAPSAPRAPAPRPHGALWRPRDVERVWSAAVPLSLVAAAFIALVEGPCVAAYLASFVWLVVGFAGIIASRRGERLAREIEAAFAQGCASPSHEAGEAFVQLLWRARNFPHVHRRAVLLRAVVHARHGELESAVGLIEMLDESMPLDHPLRADPAFALHAAETCALADDVPAARRWLRRVEQLDGHGSAPEISVVESIVLLREWRHPDAAALLERAVTPGRDAPLDPHKARRDRALLAFALDGTQGADVRAVRAALSQARGGPPGELGYVGARWPEFAAFAARYEL